ncbi:MAG: 2'-5' RNA ligase family protein [Pseudonocardia sp.]|nr:2'-5' RNA ligase family protein [Pseudonocardia sp.]
MPRLFTALWPPQPAIAELRAALEQEHRWPPRGWRPVPPERWHVTLCFHGEADPDELARQLDVGVGGARAPWLRLAGAVSFPRVLAAGVSTSSRADAAALAALVRASGADPDGYRAHATVARSGRWADAPSAEGPLMGFLGSWWRPQEVCLVRSDLGSAGRRYVVIHRVALRADLGPGPPRTGPLTRPWSGSVPAYR